MNQANPIRVMVVDDHDIVRTGLGIFLKTIEDMEMVGEARNGKEAVKLCADLQPDVILMDLRMPDGPGIQAIRKIRKHWPMIHIIALTNFDDERRIQDALAAGAIGYLLKNASIHELAEAIRAARAGNSILADEVMQTLVKAATRPPIPDLTPREMEVLALIVEGLGNDDIADKLVISVSTVKNHVSQILSKLDVSSRTEAMALAIKRHIIE